MSNKEEQLNRLIDCLIREDSRLSDLVSAADAQMEALRDNDLAAIKSAVERINAITGSLATLEEERLQVQAALDKELGLSPGCALAEVLPHTDGEVRKTLDALLTEMREKARLLKEVNETNNIMTRQALAFNGLLLRAFDPAVGRLTYGNDGATEHGTVKRSLFERTV